MGVGVSGPEGAFRYCRSTPELRSDSPELEPSTDVTGARTQDRRPDAKQHRADTPIDGSSTSTAVGSGGWTGEPLPLVSSHMRRHVDFASMTEPRRAASAAVEVRPPFLRSHWKVVSRWGAGLALLAATFASVDASAAFGAIREASPGLVVCVLLLTVFQTLLLSFRWSYTARRLGIPLDWGTATRDYYVSLLLNSVIPGGIAGDITRIVRRGRELGRLEAVARSVVIERVIGQVALLGVLLVSTMIWGAENLLQTLAIGFAATAACTAIAWILVRRPTGRIGQMTKRLLDDARLALSSEALLVQLGLSTLSVVSLVFMFWLCAVATQTPLGLSEALLVVPWVLAATTLPITVGGWGVREATSAALFELVRFDAAQGAAASVLFGLTTLCGALPGVIFILRKSADPSRRPWGGSLRTLR